MPRHRQQQRVHQLDLAPVVVHQRREAAADAEIDARARIDGVGVPEVVALLGRHHLERQLVVVAQEDRPLAAVGDVRRLAHDVGDRVPVLLRQRHVHARHQREVERHVAFVALAEIGPRVLRPLVGLGEQHAVGIVRVDLGADRLQDVVRLRQVLVVRALALDR